MTVKLNLGSGAHPLPGFVNLDLATGWRFEDGLAGYPDESVDAISISHALMYVALADWPAVFAELARVLRPGGVVRITEDATDDPASERFGGYHDAVTLTTKRCVELHMHAAGFERRAVADRSLIQRWHGAPPKTFDVEGVKP